MDPKYYYRPKDEIENVENKIVECKKLLSLYKLYQKQNHKGYKEENEGDLNDQVD